MLGRIIGSHATFFGVVLIWRVGRRYSYSTGKHGVVWQNYGAVTMHTVITVRGSRDEDRTDKPMQMITHGVDLSFLWNSPLSNASSLLQRVDVVIVLPGLFPRTAAGGFLPLRAREISSSTPPVVGVLAPVCSRSTILIHHIERVLT